MVLMIGFNCRLESVVGNIICFGLLAKLFEEL